MNLQKHNHKILNTIQNNWSKSHGDTWLFYHIAFDMLMLTDKLNLKCYVLYQTKELLTITKMLIAIINILMSIIGIAIFIIVIIIVIIITITTKY